MKFHSLTHSLTHSLILLLLPALFATQTLKLFAQCNPAPNIDIDWTFTRNNLNLDDVGWDVIPFDDDNDGVAEDGFIIVGSTNISSTNSDVWIVCIDYNKNYLWDEYYGGSLNDVAYSVVQSSYNEKIIVCGKTRDDYFETDDFTDNIWLLEIDFADGSLDREAQYGGSGNEVGFAIADVPSDFYVIAGKTGRHADEDLTGQDINAKGDYWVLEINADDLTIN